MSQDKASASPGEINYGDVSFRETCFGRNQTVIQVYECLDHLDVDMTCELGSIRA